MRSLPCFAPSLIALALSLAAPARADGPTAEQVGDPFSFGRSVVHLGRAVTLDYSLSPDCIPGVPTCFKLAPQPLESQFRVENAAATIELPADAAQSLVCFTITPFLQFEFQNLTGVRQDRAAFRVNADVLVENEVLNDPLLIDPATGEPYGGHMRLVLRLHDESRSLGPEDRAGQIITTTRACIGGFANRVDLMAAGLSEAQATDFFHKPIRLVFGISGNAAMVTEGLVGYGVRVYGDR